eukprot:371674_1
MGLFSSKLNYDFRDYHETFIFGQDLTHRALRRSVRAIIDFSGGNGVVIDETRADFLRYVQLFCAFLQVHHQQEDRFIFPKARSLSGDDSLLKQQNSEHQTLAALLERLVELAKVERNGDSEPKLNGESEPKDEAEQKDDSDGNSEKLMREICSVAQEMETLLTGHLAVEEKILTADFFRDHCTEKDTKALSEQIHGGIIDEFMDRGASLVYFVYHLTESEQVFFDERIPWFVKSFFFPRYALRNNISATVWKFAPHAHFNASGSPCWGNPRFIEDERRS